MSESDRNVTFVVQHKVKQQALSRYEDWLKVIVKRATDYQGHQGVHIIRPPSGGTDYAAIIRWDTFENARKWAESQDRKSLLMEINDALEEPDSAEIRPGIEFWFTPPGQLQKKAPPWKQWLVTTSVIWPLSMLVPKVLQPLFHAVPVFELWPIRLLIIAAVIVGLVTYVIMPYYVRAVSTWMFK